MGRSSRSLLIYLASLVLLSIPLVLWAQAPNGDAPPEASTSAAPADDGPATLWDMILQSGWSGITFMVVLGLFSLAALALILERLFNLTRGNVIPPAFADELERLTQREETNVAVFRKMEMRMKLTRKSVEELQREGLPESVAAKLAPLVDRPLPESQLDQELDRLLVGGEKAHRARIRSLAQPERLYDAPLANVVRASLLRAGRPVPEVEKAMEDALAREVAAMRGKVRPLNVIAAVAPLVGLLGTVVGMIMAFRTASLQGLGGRAELLAEGIYLALLTTAAGLTIAIPALLGAAYFNTRIDQFMREMDERLMTMIPCFARMQARVENGGPARNEAPLPAADGTSTTGQLVGSSV